MSLAVLYSRAASGIDAPLVTVEVHLSNGLPSFTIVGLPEAAVKEARDRVRSALINSSFSYPARKITCNLAPADLPKEGGRFDLAIALGILAASGQIPPERLRDYEFVGELALTGELRPVPGVLPAALATARAGRGLVVARANGPEAALAAAAEVRVAGHLLEVSAFLLESGTLEPAVAPAVGASVTAPDLADVRGQVAAKRALEIAAAGGHHLLLIGPPGTGKSMLAARLAGIAPAPDTRAALEIAAVASVSDAGFDPARWAQRPVRAPHHTASAVALVGGGSIPRPGEISLAHEGVLFLDEFPEFDRRVLEALREPLETGRVTVSRAARQAEFPARFQLVAAMNPCPCGYYGERSRRCQCSAQQVQRYRARISGPLLDRIDLHVEVPAVDPAELRQPAAGETSGEVRQRVEQARARMLKRQGAANALLAPGAIAEQARLGEDAARLLGQAMQRLGLSARAYHRVLRVARTIADLDSAETIAAPHVAEALQYRQLDRAVSAA
ncbi:MAG: YifB family Mg chelatase-like AAA ATPase [Chromatiales bacterium]|nr:YifB family Mg chelatase-like AAA ATPase [Chromatiales bacterium]